VTGAEYVGTIALRDVPGPPSSPIAALALTAWSDSFVLHGIEALPTPPPTGPIPPWRLGDATSDTEDRHRSRGGGGHGHPRFFWETTFDGALSAAARSLTLSIATGDETIDAVVPLPNWPPGRTDAPARVTTDTTSDAPTLVDRGGTTLPDRVIAISADLGVLGGIRRAMTSLYCWPSWFMVTLEARGSIPASCGPMTQLTAWSVEDDRGNRYAGRWTGGWSGRHGGAHGTFTPQLDPMAQRLHVEFDDPFGDAGKLCADVALPMDQLP
jgi:hypothetical protein